MFVGTTAFTNLSIIRCWVALGIEGWLIYNNGSLTLRFEFTLMWFVSVKMEMWVQKIPYSLRILSAIQKHIRIYPIKSCLTITNYDSSCGKFLNLIDRVVIYSIRVYYFQSGLVMVNFFNTWYSVVFTLKARPKLFYTSNDYIMMWIMRKKIIWITKHFIHLRHRY